MPEILNLAFLEVDRQVNMNEGKSSGCTAVVAFVEVKNEKVCSMMDHMDHILMMMISEFYTREM